MSFEKMGQGHSARLHFITWLLPSRRVHHTRFSYTMPSRQPWTRNGNDEALQEVQDADGGLPGLRNNGAQLRVG